MIIKTIVKENTKAKLLILRCLKIILIKHLTKVENGYKIKRMITN